MLPYNSSLKEKARTLRKNSSRAEILLWTGLRRRQINNMQFHRQRMIGNYIVDFYCKELKLAIEVDDKSHDVKYEYDSKRTKELELLGITVLRISNKDVLTNFEGVVESIRQYVDKMRPSP